MTLIAIWSDNPQKSVFVGADSRLTGAVNKKDRWDNASKIFQIANFPEVVAYCGTTEPLLTAISQTALCLRYTDTLTSRARHGPQLTARLAAAINHLNEAIRSYPKGWMRNGGTMFFVGYDKREKRARVFRVAVSTTGVKSINEHEPGEQDELDLAKAPFFFGSGATQAEALVAKGKSAFEALKLVALGTRAKTVGGIPQVVRVQRSGVRPIGIVSDGKPYVFGMLTKFKSKMKKVEWRNLSFRKCDYPLQAKVKRRRRRRPR